MSEEKQESGNGFKRNKNNYPLMMAVAGMFISAIVWIIVSGAK